MADRKIQIVLTAVDKTKRAFGSAQKSVARFGASVAKVASSLGFAFGAGGGGAVAGIAAMASQMDKLAKTAAKLGTTTEELSKLQFAAKQTGVEARTLELALQRMVRKIGDAQGGSKEAAAAFSRLGLDFADLAKLSPEQQFLAIADGVSRLDSDTAKLSATVKIFDSEAAGIINTLMAGPQALKDFGDEAERTGNIVSTKTAKAAEQFNDNLSIMAGNLKGIGISLANEVLPTLAKLTTVLAAESLHQGIGRLSEGLTIMPQKIRDVKAEIVLLKEDIRTLGETRGQLGNIFGTDEAIDRIRERISKLRETETQLMQEWFAERQKIQVDAGIKEVAIAEQLTESLEQAREGQIKTQEEYVKDLQKVVDDEVELLKRIELAGRAVQDGVEAVQIGDTLDAGDLFARVHEGIAQLAGGDADAARATIENIAEAMDELNKRGELTATAANNLRALLAKLAKDVTAAREQGIIDAESVRDEAAEVEETLSRAIQPKVSLVLDTDSIEQIKRAAEAALSGYSLPVTVVGVAEGQGAPGSSGEPVFGDRPISDQSEATGHRL